MRYTQLTDNQVNFMLESIGASSIDELFAGIDDAHREQSLLKIPRGLTEPELLEDLGALERKNAPCNGDRVCFLGGGVYDHFSPTVVDYLATQGEFLTAYTPYQAEASQGSLQAFYEFQTMICQLTGMEVANASLYEQATAVAEAVLMAAAVTGRRRILVSRAIHPDAFQVLRTLTYEQPIEVIPVDRVDGRTNMESVGRHMDNTIAAVVLQSPSFFGAIEKVSDAVAAAHSVGALVIQSVDPISCGILKRPGDLDVDVAVGDAQPLGIPMSYGGPFCGFFACREAYLRRMPGRVVGMTRDAEGKRGFCLTLQTREQHIRRERATSNVCTNQGLLALRAAVHMAALGKQGLGKISQMCLDHAHYAADRIAGLRGFELKFAAPFFREFVVRTDHSVTRVLDHCRRHGIEAGIALGQWYDDLCDCFMVAVTEKRSKAQIDALVETLNSV